MRAQQPAKKTPERELREWFGSSLSGDNCKPIIGDNDEGGRICKGLQGYSLLVKGDEKRPQIFLISLDGARHAIHYWDLNDPGYHGMDQGVSWIVVNTPKKTIAMEFRLKVEPKEDYAQWADYDVIVRVSPGPVCVVGSVPSGSSAAAETVAIASSPAARPCLGINALQKRDWFLTARRLAGEGKVEEAMSALKRVKGTDRFIIYREISNAQFRADDREAARRTLMTARAEALKKRHVEELRFTLIHMVEGLAEAGFYEAAKGDVDLFPQNKRLNVHLSIAWFQAERNDLEAAKTTYREIIELEMSKTPRPARDWNLVRICESQARLRLFDEAKRTASLIQDPDAKRVAEDRLPKQP
jgi:hypothetical protein